MRCVNAVNVTGDETVTVNFEFSRLNTFYPVILAHKLVHFSVYFIEKQNILIHAVKSSISINQEKLYNNKEKCFH